MTAKFFTEEDYARVRRMIADRQQLVQAYSELKKAEPVPAVLYQMLRIFRIWARDAADAKDWQKVVDLYGTYTRYAKACTPHCMKIANQPPPELNARDQALLDRARANLPTINMN
jgi:hypothetical protein